MEYILIPLIMLFIEHRLTSGSGVPGMLSSVTGTAARDSLLFLLPLSHSDILEPLLAAIYNIL